MYNSQQYPTLIGTVDLISSGMYNSQQYPTLKGTVGVISSDP